jgi:peptidoglycan/LPS O-acetylase OafA/YrhL
MKEMLNLDSIPAHLLLIQALHLYPTPTLNTSSWSLSTEWWVYMLFPFITLLIPKTGTAWSKMTALLLVVLCYFGLILIVNLHQGEVFTDPLNLIFSRSLSVTADWGMLRCAAGFFWGMVISRLFNNKDLCRLLCRDYVCFLLFLITLLGLHFDVNALFVIFLFGIIVLALSYNKGRVAQMLQMSPFQVLGRLSFSIYLTHVPVIFALWIWILDFRPDALLFPGIVGASIKLSGITVFLLMAAITIVVSAITYRFVELPGRKHLT